MKKYQRLFESLTSRVFHYTDITKALLILKNRRFNLRAASGIEQKLGRGRYYFLSLARSPSADYAVQSSYKTGVNFNLNGDWLNRKYKSVPIDYWERMWMDPQTGKTVSGRRSEQEDRIISNSPYIDFPSESSSLVSEIHILCVIDQNETLSEYNKRTIRSLIFEAKKQGVKVYVYGRREDWLVQNRVKSILNIDFIDSLKPKTPVDISGSRTWAERDYFKEWRELYHKSSKKDLSPRADKLRYNIVFGWSDTHLSLDADIHNARMSVGLNKLISIFKKIGVKTSKEYVEWLRDKWRNINESKKPKQIPVKTIPPVDQDKPLNWTIKHEKKATKGITKHNSTKGLLEAVKQIEEWIKTQPKIPSTADFPAKFNAHRLTHVEHPTLGKMIDIHLVGSQVLALINVKKSDEDEKSAVFTWIAVGSHGELGI